MFFHAYRPEEGLCCNLRTFNTYLHLHAPDKKEETFATVFAFGNRLFQKVFLTPEALTPIDHGLRLGAESEEEYGGGQNYPVGGPDVRVYFRHVVIQDAFTRGIASSTVLTRDYMHRIQVEGLDSEPRCLDPLYCLTEE